MYEMDRVSAALFIPVIIVILARDLPGGLVQFAIDLLSLLTGQPSAVRCTIIVYLLIDVGLSAVGAGSLARGHLSIAEPICDALVLVALTLIDR